MNIKSRSIWEEESFNRKIKYLTGNITADVAVIGAGMAGILTAYKLKKRGLNVVVIEAETVGSGVTKNTTAKITSQHNITYKNLLNSHGIKKAKKYAEANQNAIDEYKEIIDKLNIECEFERVTAFVYSNCDKDTIRREMNAAIMCGIDAFYAEKSDLPFQIKAMYGFRNQAQFHPLKFLFAVAETLDIYENTKALDVKDGQIITERGTVTAQHIVICTHYPFINTPGYYFTRVHQERSYLIAVKAKANFDDMYISADKSGYSFRKSGDYVLIGGSSHRTGDTKSDCYSKLIHAARLYYPRSQITNCWSAQDCVSLDNLPYIGRYSSAMPRVYVATGFKKWGMSLSMVSADVITDLIMTNKSKYENLFTPQRFNIQDSYKNMGKNIKYMTKSMFNKYFITPKTQLETLEKDSGAIINFQGKKIGVYRDKNGKYHAVSVVCPHLGCELTFNNQDKTWDCPCHGSRFNIHGEVLDNPAITNLDSRTITK